MNGEVVPIASAHSLLQELVETACVTGCFKLLLRDFFARGHIKMQR